MSDDFGEPEDTVPFDPQTKPANECTPHELLTELMRQGVDREDILQVHWNQYKPAERNDDGDFKAVGMAVDIVTIIRKVK